MMKVDSWGKQRCNFKEKLFFGPGEGNIIEEKHIPWFFKCLARCVYQVCVFFLVGVLFIIGGAVYGSS